MDNRSSGTWANTEFRDDRVCSFFTRLSAGRHEIVYDLRAETPGTVHLLPGFLHPMDAEYLHGETGSDRLDVVERPKRAENVPQRVGRAEE